MNEITDYQNTLSEAVNARKQRLEKSEIVKLRGKFQAFHTAYTSLYALLLKKGLVKEDPYKGEAKLGEICIPESGSFSESESDNQLSIRLAGYDNQLDFLVNFYTFNVDFFTLDRIKRILGLVKYIDWVGLSASSPSPTTAVVASLINRLRGGNDAVGTNIVNGVTVTLSKLTLAILADLKVLTDFNRQAYKLDLRNMIKGAFSEGKIPSVPEIKKAFAAAKSGLPFYAELAEELIKEDYSPEGPALRDRVLKSLGMGEAKAEDKPKAAKQEVSLKPILIEGIKAIGSISSTINQIGEKIDANELILESRNTNFLVKIKRIMDQMLNKDPEPTVYEIEYNNKNQGKANREKLNFSTFREDMDKKARNLVLAKSQGNLAKFETMPEDQLVTFLERTIKEMRTLHRVLTALDDYFKNTVNKEDRDKVKGIKPELVTIKNGFLKASEKILEYSNLKEDEALKGLSINSTG